LKKVILVSILLIPSLIYFFFELTQANFTKMAYYGPKIPGEKGDTLYYTLPDKAFELYSLIREQKTDSLGNDVLSDVLKEKQLAGKSFIVLFVGENPKRKDKLSGLMDFIKYKEKEAKELPIVMIKGDDCISGPNYPMVKGRSSELDLSAKYMVDSLGINFTNISLLSPAADDQIDQLKRMYFEGKPSHIMYHFAVLVDKNRHIRGYYDPDYFGEVKRLDQEYKHLVLKEEHMKMEETDKIEKAK
jgi:hypothetical protein